MRSPQTCGLRIGQSCRRRAAVQFGVLERLRHSYHLAVCDWICAHRALLLGNAASLLSASRKGFQICHLLASVIFSANPWRILTSSPQTLGNATSVPTVFLCIELLMLSWEPRPVLFCHSHHYSNRPHSYLHLRSPANLLCKIWAGIEAARSIARAPFRLFGQTLQSLSTVRAYG